MAGSQGFNAAVVDRTEGTDPGELIEGVVEAGDEVRGLDLPDAGQGSRSTVSSPRGADNDAHFPNFVWGASASLVINFEDGLVATF